MDSQQKVKTEIYYQLWGREALKEESIIL